MISKMNDCVRCNITISDLDSRCSVVSFTCVRLVTINPFEVVLKNCATPTVREYAGVGDLIRIPSLHSVAISEKRCLVDVSLVVPKLYCIPLADRL
jgi:hypothetical protein